MDENPLVPMIPSEISDVCQDAYRQLGVTLLLSCCKQGEVCDRSFADSYKHHLEALQSGTLYLLLSGDSVPKGYATWKVCEKGKVELVDFVAPFGDHLQLHSELKLHLRGFDILQNEKNKELNL